MNLLALAARTTSGTGSAQVVPAPLNVGLKAAALHLRVTAAATEVGDMLDVFAQHSVDGGTTWTDFARFTQVLGNDSVPKNFFAHWVALMAPTTAQHAAQDGTMSAGVNQGPIGNLLRIKWVITQATTTGNESFTFSVDMTPTL